MGFSYVKVFDYRSIGFFIQQADNINSQSWNDETGNDFVNTGVSKKFFPDKHCTATEENACNSAFDSSAAPEKAEQYKRAYSFICKFKWRYSNGWCIKRKKRTKYKLWYYY